MSLFRRRLMMAGGGKITYPVYGVTGLMNENPILSRTDDALGMSFVINSSSGSVSSDFDYVFPWNEAKVVTINNNKFLRMPEMWFRVTMYNPSKPVYTAIAVSKKPNGEGDWYKVDSFYYGCYGASSTSTTSALNSVSGQSRRSSRTRAQFRSQAAANGTGYFQKDLYHHTVMWFLWLIEWANKNNSQVLPGRRYTTRVATGSTDALSTPSGFNTSNNQMRWHYIEDFVGNYSEFIDGAYGSLTSAKGTADVAGFNDTGAGMVTAGGTTGTYGHLVSNKIIRYFYWDRNNPFLSLPYRTLSADETNDFEKNFCDLLEIEGNGIVHGGAVYETEDGYSYVIGGLFHFTYRPSNSASWLSARLLYKP